MTNLPDWLNAAAATAAAIFSYLAWRSTTRVQEPEAIITSADMMQDEGAEPYAIVRFAIRNLTDKTLYVRAISFARTGVPLEVAQGYEPDAYGSRGTPKDFRGTDVENVGWMVVRPVGSAPGMTVAGDTLRPYVELRFPGTLPANILAVIAYSYGSPTGRRHRIATNAEPLRMKGV